MTIFNYEKINHKVAGFLSQEFPQGTKAKNAGTNKKAIGLENACSYTDARENKCKGWLDRKESNWFASAARRYRSEKSVQQRADDSSFKAPVKRPENKTSVFNKEKAKEQFLGLVHQQNISVTESLQIGPLTFVSPDAVRGSIRYQHGFSSYVTVDGKKVLVKTQVQTGDLFLFGPEGISSKQLKKARYFAQALGYLELPKNPEGLRGFYQPSFRGNP